MEMLELAAELKWCREQNEILRQGVERCKEVCLETSRLWSEDMLAAEATISRLREYVRHKRDCATLDMETQYETGKRATCDCGYDALIAAKSFNPATLDIGKPPDPKIAARLTERFGDVILAK